MSSLLCCLWFIVVVMMVGMRPSLVSESSFSRKDLAALDDHDDVLALVHK